MAGVEIPEKCEPDSEVGVLSPEEDMGEAERDARSNGKDLVVGELVVANGGMMSNASKAEQTKRIVEERYK